jgi:hypothetical protein
MNYEAEVERKDTAAIVRDFITRHPEITGQRRSTE